MKVTRQKNEDHEAEFQKKCKNFLPDESLRKKKHNPIELVIQELVHEKIKFRIKSTLYYFFKILVVIFKFSISK